MKRETHSACENNTREIALKQNFSFYSVSARYFSLLSHMHWFIKVFHTCLYHICVKLNMHLNYSIIQTKQNANKGSAKIFIKLKKNSFIVFFIAA
jgi:hypothetical protein